MTTSQALIGMTLLQTQYFLYPRFLLLSPPKVVNVELDTEEKLLDFYSDLNNICQLAGANPLRDEDNGSDTDPDFIDIDYELEDEADDLLVENIDEDFIDEGVVEGTR
jgi:hypothetical protein